MFGSPPHKHDRSCYGSGQVPNGHGTLHWPVGCVLHVSDQSGHSCRRRTAWSLATLSLRCGSSGKHQPQLPRPICLTNEPIRVSEELSRRRQIKERTMLEGLFQPTHLLVIFGIALLVFGPKKLPELGKGIGEGIRGFKSAIKAERRQTRNSDVSCH